MSPGKNFIKTPRHISNLIYSVVYIGVFVVTCLSSFSLSQECSYIDDCRCRFPNHSIIDISSLGYRNHEPRWLDIGDKNNKFKYSYNGCYKFNLGSQSACQDVAVCQRTGDSTGQEYNCGKTTRFIWTTTKGLQILYNDGTGSKGRNTTVTLVCSRGAYEPQLEVIGELPTLLNYEMTLTTRCACSDLCRESHLSTGSVLVILFMIFAALYLVLGIIHSSLTRGAHGWELIPHYEFWSDFPLLVRDGCVFVVSGCKTDTAYERI